MSDEPPRRASWALWLPLALVAGFVALVLAQLRHPADTTVTSALVGKPLPAIALTPAVPDRPGIAAADRARGRPRLLNVFASWCVPCAAEAPQLARLAAQGVEIDGVAIRDQRDALAAFLARNGDPYARIGADPVGEVQLAIGSSGVPETFVIDARGTIRYQHIGEIRPEHVPMLLAKLREAGV